MDARVCVCVCVCVSVCLCVCLCVCVGGQVQGKDAQMNHVVPEEKIHGRRDLEKIHWWIQGSDQGCTSTSRDCVGSFLTCAAQAVLQWHENAGTFSGLTAIFGTILLVGLIVLFVRALRGGRFDGCLATCQSACACCGSCDCCKRSQKAPRPTSGIVKPPPAKDDLLKVGTR